MAICLLHGVTNTKPGNCSKFYNNSANSQNNYFPYLPYLCQKHMIKKGVYIAFACWLLMVSTGFTINKHFCQNQLQKILVWVQPGSCHDSTSGNSCNSKKHQCTHATPEEEANCCTNESDFVQLDADLVKPDIIQNFLPDFFSFSFFSTVFTTPNITHHYSNSYLLYKPPLVLSNIPLLGQVFLC